MLNKHLHVSKHNNKAEVTLPSTSLTVSTEHLLSPTVKLATNAKFLRTLASKVRSFLPDSLQPPNSWNASSKKAGRFDRRANNMEQPASVPDNPPKDKVEKSYLATAADYIPSWGGSRSATPKPVATTTAPGESSGLKNQHGGDHQTQHWHGLSRKRYPADCPPLNARWFYAVDVCCDSLYYEIAMLMNRNSSHLSESPS